MGKSAILAALRSGRTTSSPVSPSAASTGSPSKKKESIQPHSELTSLKWLSANFSRSETTWELSKAAQAVAAIAVWRRGHVKGEKNTDHPILVTRQVEKWLKTRPAKGRPEIVPYSGPQTSQPFGLSIAAAALAETGNLVMHSSGDSPAAFQFLCDHHCVLLKRSRIYRYYEDYWRVMGKDAAHLRAINWICGPSRSADVEQTLQLGAHGPLSLHVIILEQ